MDAGASVDRLPQLGRVCPVDAALEVGRVGLTLRPLSPISSLFGIAGGVLSALLEAVLCG